MFKTIALRNFLCFNSATFDLTGPRDTALPYAVVYGKNASGKTSLMESVRFLKRSAGTFSTLRYSQDIPDGSGTGFGRMLSDMMRDRRMTLPDLVRGYMMDGSDGSMELEYRFAVGGKDATYRLRFSVDGDLEHESLHYTSRKGRTIPYFTAEAGEKPVLRLNDDPFPDSQFRRSVEDLFPPYWGRHTFLSMICDDVSQRNRDYMDGLSPNLMALIDYIGELNSGVTGIGGESSKRLESDLVHGWMDSGDLEVCEAYGRAIERFFTRIDKDVESVRYEFRDSSEFQVEYMLYFDRYISGKVRHIPATRESAGVRKLLGLLPMLLGCADGKVAFVDEMDSGIHDKLIHDLFLQILPEMKGQLVVTTHNTSLLRDLDPHMVFQIEVDMEGDRTIGVMSGGKRTREGNNNQSRYLRNEFGGLPHISNVDMTDIVSHLREDLS